MPMMGSVCRHVFSVFHKCVLLFVVFFIFLHSIFVLVFDSFPIQRFDLWSYCCDHAVFRSRVHFMCSALERDRQCSGFLMSIWTSRFHVGWLWSTARVMRILQVLVGFMRRFSVAWSYFCLIVTTFVGIPKLVPAHCDEMSLRRRCLGTLRDVLGFDILIVGHAQEIDCLRHLLRLVRNVETLSDWGRLELFCSV